MKRSEPVALRDGLTARYDESEASEIRALYLADGSERIRVYDNELVILLRDVVGRENVLRLLGEAELSQEDNQLVSPEEVRQYLSYRENRERIRAFLQVAESSNEERLQRIEDYAHTSMAGEAELPVGRRPVVLPLPHDKSTEERLQGLEGLVGQTLGRIEKLEIELGRDRMQAALKRPDFVIDTGR